MAVYKEIGYIVSLIKKRMTEFVPNYPASKVALILDKNDDLIRLMKNAIKQYGLEVDTIHSNDGSWSLQSIWFDGGFPAVIEAGFEKANIHFVRVRNVPGVYGYMRVHTKTSNYTQDLANSWDA